LSLNKIDFSDGIRPEEIQENFEMLQEQINRERISVGGFGIASGFEITPVVDTDKFGISISAASIIDEDGTELFIDDTYLDIEPPELYQAYEACTINYNNQISLKQIPYAANRRMPAEYLNNLNPVNSGIYINYPSNNANTDDYIRVSKINGTVLTVTGAISREVVVRYRYTADRIDTVYLKQDNTIGVIRGTTSTTPSKAYMPSDGKLLIAYIMIESRYVDENIIIPSANIYVKDDMRSLRNLYTDDDNNLYICGTPFDDLQIIHMREPKNPKENALWLNTETNTLYYWKSTDGFVYHNKIVIDTDFVENKNANRDFATYMDFILGAGELEVYHAKNNGEANRLVEGVHYYELYNELPTYNQNIPSDAEGNSFRIIEDAESGNGLTLNTGDVITYMIRFKDSHYTWVPINKMTYVNAKDRKVYCTNDYMPNHKDGYFDSAIANRMGYSDLTNDDRPYPYKYQYFLFDREKDLNMHFTPGRQELSIYINQMILHADQFEELTIYDLLGRDEQGNTIDNKIPDAVAETAAIYYGWSRKALEDMANEYDNTGIGFKLIEPLDCGLNAQGHSYLDPDGSNDIYMEAVVERRIACSPLKRKLQRTATFVMEDIIVADEDIASTGIITLKNDVHYRYNEHQLEVYVNGSKLNEFSADNRNPDLVEQYGFYLHPISEMSIEDGVEYENIIHEEVIYPPIEESLIPEDKPLDQGFFERKRSAVCNMFKINKPLSVGDKITYRITTNVYSYDHVTNILDDLETRLNGSVADVTSMVQQLEDHKDMVNNRLQDMEIQVQDIRNEVLTAKDSGYFDEFGVLSMSNMPEEIIKTMVVNLNHINTSITYQENKTEYVVSDIRAADYLTVVRRNKDTMIDSFLIPGTDYSVYDKLENGIWKSTIFVLNNNINESWTTYDMIYITGIKFGKVGR
jgi:hypothetical protein